MARGAFEANTPQETDFDDPSFDTIISLPMVIVDEGLGEIIDIHYQQRYQKLEEDQTPRSIRDTMIRSYKCNIKLKQKKQKNKKLAIECFYYYHLYKINYLRYFYLY